MKFFPGTYCFLDYTISHKVLLLRNREEHSIYNTDLIFEGVYYLEIPTRIRDFSIYAASTQESKMIAEKAGVEYVPDFGMNVLIIETGVRKFYIGCVRLLIKENTLNYIDSSIREAR